MQLSIDNLIHKKQVVLDLGTMDEVPVQQLKNRMRFSDFRIDIIHGKIGKDYKKSRKKIMKGLNKRL